MVALWIKPGLSGEIDEGGIVRLSDGRTFDLSSVPGNGYNQNRLDKINEAIRKEITHIQPLADLPADDPDKTTNPNRYPRLYWGDADGVPDPAGEYLCSRTVSITLTWDGTRLWPRCEVAR